MVDRDDPDFLSGSRPIRVALQVNTFQYQLKNRQGTAASDEDAHNTSIVNSCKDNQIEMIAVTDHFAISNSQSLISHAETEGIAVLPGFEAVSSEGVHLLCIFERGTKQTDIQNCIGACGVISSKDEEGICNLTAREILAKAEPWGCVVVAAHATDSGGALQKLSGASREAFWCDERLTAVALTVHPTALSPSFKDIVEERQVGYKRKHLLATIYASDVNSGEDVVNKKAYTELQVSSRSLEGVRHAFLDPESRVRLPEDAISTSLPHLISISWVGGFLDGVTIPLNRSLNVLIGPRGAGKSTVLESIRFALDLETLGSDAKLAHEGFVEMVLGAGTKVILSTCDAQGDGTWVIEKSVNGSTVVKHGGSVVDSSPKSIVGEVEFFGQHEVAELAKSPEVRASLLRRFIPLVGESGRSHVEILEDLRSNRVEILNELMAQKKLARNQEDLPALTEKLTNLEEGGVRARLDKQTRFVKETPILDEASDLIEHLRGRLDEFDEINLSFLDDEIIDEMPTRSGIIEVRGSLEQLAQFWAEAKVSLAERIADAERKHQEISTARAVEIAAQGEEYMAVLRELKAENIDGAKIMSLETEKANLEANLKKITDSKSRVKKLRTRRRNVLKEWETFRRREFAKLEVAANKVNKELSPTVRVNCGFEGNRAQIVSLLRERVGGQLHNVISAIEAADDSFDSAKLAESCRKGEAAVSRLLNVSGAQVRKVASVDEEVLLIMEELWLGPITEVELCVGKDEDSKPIWRGLRNLSTGEKATAILLILLLGSDDSVPLVIDQAEDDLDNSFIADGIVPRLRAEKTRRQFILSTHNPNIPVLGDAEQVVRLTPLGEAVSGGRAIAKPDQIGSLDRPSVRRAVESLEGGKEAFEKRRRRYGY